MTIAYEPREQPDHLRLECSGDFAQDAVLRIYAEGFELAAKGGFAALLIDARKVGGREPTLAERYQQAVWISDLQARQRPRIRLAVLGHEPLVHRERFGEIIATRRGAVARAFTDEKFALEWLLGGAARTAAHQPPDALD
jgi:hypothetical protein